MRRAIRDGLGQKSSWLIFLLVLALLALGAERVHAATAGPPSRHVSGGHVSPQQAATLQPFPATGLPAGPATGVPVHATFPAGTNVKHAHGGPTYVYVISGSLDILDSDGTTTTYDAGSFFWESPGHVHTLQVSQRVEVFYLQFLPPGAEALIPVQ